MSKEIYISTTPHETRLAIVEDEQLAEIYYERENEYTLAGSIYNGKVTRVLPGMQSSFVDIGLERDAFLYVTDFMEEQGDAADFESESGGGSRQSRDEGRREEGRKDENGSRGARDRGRRGRRDATEPARETTSFDEPIAPAPVEGSADPYDNQAALDEQGSRRWRGRRGRRRGRGGREGGSADVATSGSNLDGETLENDGETIVLEGSSEDEVTEVPSVSADGAITIDLEAAEEAENLGRRNVHRPGRMGRPGSEERAVRQSALSEREPQHNDGRRRDDSRGRGERRPFGSREREEEVVPSGAAITVLPGESIRRYRDPAELAAEDDARRATAPSLAEPVVSARPSIDIVGWDGGATLPGESLSRHRRPAVSNAAESKQSTSAMNAQVPHAAAHEAAPTQAVSEETTVAGSQQVLPSHPEQVEPISATPIPDADSDVPAATAPEETGGLTQHPAHGDEHAAVGPEAAPNTHDLVAAAEAAVAAPDAGEYEPEEGEGASLRDDTRQNLRRRERADAASKRSSAEASAESPTHAESDTARDERREEESSGGILSIFGAAGVPGPAERASVSDPIAPEASIAEAVQAESHHAELVSEAASHADPVASAERNDLEGDAESPAFPEHEFTTLQQDGAMVTEPEQVAGDEEAELLGDTIASSELHQPVGAGIPNGEPSESAPVPQVHAYGEGDFSEEELDGDEYEYDVALAATDEDDYDDYEEETIEGSPDLGSMLQEISVDHRTLSQDSDEDEEELDVAPETGGFTVEDFGGEPAEEEQEETAPVAGGERRNRREGRDGRRGGRDRGQRGERPFRGGAGADRGRGRSRQSVQTMDLPAITDLLKPGQEVLVQIAKEPIAKKGARITSHIALPGRFLVFMPTVNHTGVSRKISSDEERRRLKSILLSEKGEHQGGFIVRTAAEGATEEELRNDLRFLIQLWQDIKMRSETSKSPALIYHDLGLIERILRDQVTDNFSAIWVDSEQEYERVLRFLQRFQPSLVRRVKLYTKETPLFEHFGITTEIDKALKSKVWLKSGGSIVINQTEALVAIDINTGKYVGKTARLEDTILKTNLDAIPEIVRQIRLRDLGGIIVIDFIDMDERKNRAKVMQALEDELKTDRAPSKVLPFNDFGLVIMTRKRVKQSLERTLCVPDPITEGTGMIKSPITVANEIYVETRKMYRHIEKPDLMLRVHPEVVKQLKSNGARRLQELEEMTHKTILLKSDPALSPEQFDIH